MKKKFIFFSILTSLLVVAVSPAFGLFFMKSLGKSPDKNTRKEYALRAMNYDGRKFHNTSEVPVLVKKKEADAYAMSVKGNKPSDEIPVTAPDFAKIPEDQLNVTWLGHSSVLVQMNGLYLLFDPVFSEMISPVSWIGCRRYSKIPFNLEDLPEIDILLLSHDHYDHLDYNTILALDSKVKNYVVPLGVENHLKYWKVSPEKIHDFAWWESQEISGIKITSVPAQHFSGRSPWSAAGTLWTGWVLEDSRNRIFVTGDSGYGSHYSDIQKKFKSFDLALMECGQYGTGWPSIHMFPEQTVQAAKELNLKAVMPMHWATVDLAYNGWDDSIERFVKCIKETEIRYVTPLIGQTFSLKDIQDKVPSALQEQWWKPVK